MPIISEQRKVDSVDIIDIVFVTLYTRVRCAKEAVPYPSLLSVIVTLLPALAVVKIMILNNQLHINHSQKPGEWVDRSGLHTQPTMPQELSENDILLADPPFMEAHGESKTFHGSVCDQRDSHNVKEFLNMIGIGCQKRVWVLCEVMGAMELPEANIVMHQTVIPIEPKVKDNWIEADLEGKPHPVNR